LGCRYAFCFEGTSTALCREAYADAESLLLHVKNVDAPLKAVLDPAVASLHHIECHGPASELAKLREALSPLGCPFFALEWGFRMPSGPPVLEDATVSLSPYFKVKDVAKFKDIWKAAYDPFAHKADCVHYGFTFETGADGTVRAHCREAYTSAATVLQHLADVDGPLKAALEVAELERLEVRRPGGPCVPRAPHGTSSDTERDWREGRGAARHTCVRWLGCGVVHGGVECRWRHCMAADGEA
jgi:hypothetical protein